MTLTHTPALVHTPDISAVRWDALESYDRAFRAHTENLEELSMRIADEQRILAESGHPSGLNRQLLTDVAISEQKVEQARHALLVVFGSDSTMLMDGIRNGKTVLGLWTALGLFG